MGTSCSRGRWLPGWRERHGTIARLVACESSSRSLEPAASPRAWTPRVCDRPGEPPARDASPLAHHLESPDWRGGRVRRRSSHAIIGDRVSPELHGIAVGWLRTLADAGMIVGPLVMGTLGDVGGLAAPFVGAAVLVCALAWACYRLTAVPTTAS